MVLYSELQNLCQCRGLETLNSSCAFIAKTSHVQPLQMVRDENLKFMKNRDVYSSDYFSFVLSLASLNAVSSNF